MRCYYVHRVEVRTRSVEKWLCRLPSTNAYVGVIVLQLPPKPQGVLSPQPVRAVHCPYSWVVVRVPLWECVIVDGKWRTWPNYHGNRVQYPHCCSITMVIGCSAPAVPSQSRVRYVRTRTGMLRTTYYVLRWTYYVLRITYHVPTYIRGYCAQPRGKKNYTTRCTYVRTCVLEYLQGTVGFSSFSLTTLPVCIP